MDEFSAGTEVKLTIPYIYNNKEIVLTNFEYELLDETGVVLIAKTADPNFNTLNNKSIISISGSNNIITGKYGVRQLNCYMTYSGGTYKTTVFYKLKGNVLLLTLLVDSFMTFPQAIVQQTAIVTPLPNYDFLDDEKKVSALASSFNALKNIPYTVDNSVTEIKISTLNETSWNALPSSFKEALKTAQIIEADALTEYDEVQSKIDRGIVSETIGESSMFFNRNFKAEVKYSGISNKTYDVLKDFIYKKSTLSSNVMKIGRA